MRFFLLPILILFCSCGNRKPGKPLPTPEEIRESLVNANKIYAKQEADEIDQYIRRRGWKMENTGTGLRYRITRKENGEQAKAGQFASVNFKISLLDGTVCYSSDGSGPREFLIDQDNVESGLHEGIKYLGVGDKAVFIIPSHLAHGLLGDESKIPPKATLVFNVELLSLR